MSCPICSTALGSELLIITQPDRFEAYAGVPTEDYRRVWQDCPGCGAAIDILSEQSRQCLADIESQYYEIDFAGTDISAKYHKVMGLPPGKSDNAERVVRVLDALNTCPLTINRSWKVLDIGAGTGVFLSALLNQGGTSISEAIGIEPDPKAAAHLRSLNLFQVVEGTFPTPDSLTGFDLVTLNKVLEHIETPVVFLRNIANALSESGICYIEVPDILTIGRRPSSDNILGALHRHIHSPSSLARMIEQAGLVCLSASRIIEPSGKLSVYAFATRPQAYDTLAGL